MDQIGVLFVCLGNICRSPMAEGLFVHLVEQAGLKDRFRIDSAGTSDYHSGELPDARMRATAGSYGIGLPSRSRQVRRQDFEDYHYIVAMDQSNHEDLCRLAPAQCKATLHLMRRFEVKAAAPDVPDPYFGGPEGFENVYQILLRATQGLLDHIRKEHKF